MAERFPRAAGRTRRGGANRAATDVFFVVCDGSKACLKRSTADLAQGGDHWHHRSEAGIRYAWLIHRRTFRSSRCITLGPGRRRSWMGGWPSGQRWPVLAAGMYAGPGHAGAAAGRGLLRPTQEQHSRVREGSNTRITRTKRPYPAHVGTPAKLLSQAPDRPIAGKAGCGAALGRGRRADDRPSVKRKVATGSVSVPRGRVA
jgi:hypothetical protein